MAQLQQENEARSRVKAQLTELAKLKASDLARKDLGGDLNFESAVIFFSRTLRLFHALDEADLDDISFPKLQQIESAARATLDQFLQVQNFSLAKYSSNPIQQRNQFIDQIREYYDTVFDTVSPIIAFTTRKGTDFERLEEQAKSIVQQIEQTSQGYEKDLHNSLKSAQETVEAVRRIAQEAGVSQHFIHFRNEANENAASARPWLIATVCIAAATVLSGAGFLIWALFRLPQLTPSQSVQLAIPKVFIFTVLLSATIWAGKTYRAYRHNAVVNRHRQNALATFEAFAKAATDVETKNAVLLQATQCIFSPQQTGYVSGEPESAVPPVLEIVRNLGKSSG